MPSDAEILQRCRSGDRSAWAALVRSQGPAVLSALNAALRGRSRQEIEDLFQEFWVRLMENGATRLSGVDPGRPLGPWMVTVALNLARRRLAAPLAPSLESGGEAPAPEPEPAGDLDGVLQQMEELPPRDRLVLELAGVQGLPPERVARALGVAPQSVHVLLSRARERLRQRLEKT